MLPLGMIRFHNLLSKKYLCPLFVASSTTPRERVNPWVQALQASECESNLPTSNL